MLCRAFYRASSLSPPADSADSAGSERAAEHWADEWDETDEWDVTDARRWLENEQVAITVPMKQVEDVTADWKAYTHIFGTADASPVCASRFKRVDVTPDGHCGRYVLALMWNALHEYDRISVADAPRRIHNMLFDLVTENESARRLSAEDADNLKFSYRNSLKQHGHARFLENWEITAFAHHLGLNVCFLPLHRRGSTVARPRTEWSAANRAYVFVFNTTTDGAILDNNHWELLVQPRDSGQTRHRAYLCLFDLEEGEDMIREFTRNFEDNVRSVEVPWDDFKRHGDANPLGEIFTTLEGGAPAYKMIDFLSRKRPKRRAVPA